MSCGAAQIIIRRGADLFLVTQMEDPITGAVISGVGYTVAITLTVSGQTYPVTFAWVDQPGGKYSLLVIRGVTATMEDGASGTLEMLIIDPTNIGSIAEATVLVT
jgi:hypothetical protein